jgi:murein DD-endopeptidase MepM/ murein hydrolase activator NlpD
MRGRRGFLRLAGVGMLGGAAALMDPLAAPVGASELWGPGGPGDGLGVEASAPISTARVVVPMVFPVLGGASYTDTFLACRSGCTRKHLGQDLMGPKMRPLLATFDGVVTSMQADGSSGNYLSITSADGWTTNYLHINNDTPGTDDGRGTARWAFMPGIRVGAPVFAGQLVAWLGDSGNAESTGAHLHFELRRGSAWSGTVYNAKPSLDRAVRLSTPRTSGPHPDGVVVQAGANWTLWLLADGHRRRLLPEVFRLNGYRADAVVRVQPGEVNHYPAGADVPLRDGLLVRGPDNQVWVVAGGQRIAVPDAAAAAGLGVAVAAVPRVGAQALALTPVAADQTLPGVVRPGALLRESGSSAVWLVTAAGTRRWVPDAITLASWGWPGDHIQTVPAGTLDAVATGAVLPLRDGTLFRSPTGSVFLVTRGRRRHIPSRLVLNSFGYTAAPVAIDATIMARLPSGAALP